MSFVKKSVSLLLAVILVMTVLTVGVVPTAPKASAASWNGYNYGGGTLYGYQTILEAYGIDYDVYMKWLDDHDADSDNPRYYLGTPYVGEDHRNPHGDCDGAYGYYDTPGVEGMNCTGFVWHVLYKAAVHSGAPGYKINRLGVMGGVLSSWYSYGVYRIWFDSLEDAYDSGVLEKGDVMWIYGTSDNHNAIFYGDSPEDFIYWDSAGERNRYCEVHAIGDCRGLWVAKVTQPYNIELHIDTPSGGNGTKFGTKYMIFDSEAKAQAALDHPDDMSAWDKREGTIVLNSSGHGVYRTQSAPSASELWTGSIPRTGHSYFNSDAERVSNRNTWYAVQWSHSPGISEDESIHVFKDSGYRTASGYPIYRFYAPIKVDTPSITSMKSISDGVRIKWGAVKDAYKYRVYYRNNTGGWTRMAETASTTYLDDDVRSGKTYNYTVRCVDKYGNF
ncbi:MAG: fibronectin type III domain-containing protein, partial [Ruminococcus sp.]|nr:fibronectin type III domain-containing protein [Ruminococcus sp.]